MTFTYQYRMVQERPAPLAPSVSLVFVFGDNVLAVALRAGRPLVVGRAAPSDVVIDDLGLSRTHARFALQGSEVLVEDLGSTNGTVVAGRRVTRTTLTSDQLLLLGGVEVRVAGATATPHLESPATGAFALAVEQECVRARFFGRSFAVAALASRGAPSDTLARVLRPVDVVEPYTPNLTLLLLPEAGELEVKSLADALFRAAPGAYRVGAVVFPGFASSAEELITECLRAAGEAHDERVRFSARHEPTVAMQPVVLAPSMVRVHGLVASAARTTIPVLILGETGSGKESLAQAVHTESARRKGPFQAVNCAALASTLISATLFGHERGAFTGADRQSPGLFERASGGTLFLDEVGELSPEAQAALLRALETKRIVRVGGSKEIEVDVRLVAATHRDLPGMVNAGSFREDLLYRLDAFTVRVPPLRERNEEILPLAAHFLAHSRARWNSRATGLSESVQHKLLSYAWPGNARQLRNVIERAAVVCGSGDIQLDDLPDSLFDKTELTPPPPLVAHASDGALRPSERLHPAAGPDLPRTLPERLRDYEERILRETLVSTQGNQSEAARLLGLPRRTLAHKVHGYGLARS